MDARNALLAEMTDEVAALVLRNNYLQTLALSLARAARHGGLRLPAAADADAGSARAARPRGRVPARRHGARRAPPPLAAVHAAGAFGAARLCQARRSTRTCSNPRCRTIPISPANSTAISRRRSPSAFPTRSTHHRLRREIIATQLANSMINRGGPSLIVRIADQTGAAPAAIAAAFAAVRDSYGMTALNTAIDGLDNRIAGEAAARTLSPRCRTSCSTASSGSCAMSICRRALPTS